MYLPIKSDNNDKSGHDNAKGGNDNDKSGNNRAIIIGRWYAYRISVDVFFSLTVRVTGEHKTIACIIYPSLDYHYSRIYIFFCYILFTLVFKFSLQFRYYTRKHII